MTEIRTSGLRNKDDRIQVAYFEYINFRDGCEFLKSLNPSRIIQINEHVVGDEIVVSVWYKVKAKG